MQLKMVLFIIFLTMAPMVLLSLSLFLSLFLWLLLSLLLSSLLEAPVTAYAKDSTYTYNKPKGYHIYNQVITDDDDLDVIVDDIIIIIITSTINIELFSSLLISLSKVSP